MYYYLQLPYFSVTQRQVCFTALIKTDRIFFFRISEHPYFKDGNTWTKKKETLFANWNSNRLAKNEIYSCNFYIKSWRWGCIDKKEKHSLMIYIYIKPLPTYLMLFVSHRESDNHILCINPSRKTQCMENMILIANRIWIQYSNIFT